MMHLEVALSSWGGEGTGERERERQRAVHSQCATANNGKKVCVILSPYVKTTTVWGKHCSYKASSHNKGGEWRETQKQGEGRREKMFANHIKKIGKEVKWDEERKPREKKQNRQKKRQMSEQGFSGAVGAKENATNNEMSILPTSSLSLSLLRLFSSGPHYQCTWTRG